MRDLKIFTENIEPEAAHQVYTLLAQPAFEGQRVRIMPDVHYGKGCVVGFTATLSDKIIPNVLGSDLGCGMLTAELGRAEIDLPAFDARVKELAVRGVPKRVGEAETLVKDLACRKTLGDLSRTLRGLGTTGGGNHFVEMDADGAGNRYLVVHTGSRGLGLKVAAHYRARAVKACKSSAEEERARVIAALKDSPELLPDAIAAVNAAHAHRTKIPAPLCYLDGTDMLEYLHDLRICQAFASLNRRCIADELLRFAGVRAASVFETVHNYLGEDNVLRKGAISAHKGERVVIPMNMRDGCLIAVGKGNADWNESAPHGAGRALKRSEAKELFSVEEFREEMRGVFTTTATAATLDECPMAYKPAAEIMSLIGDTVETVAIAKPVYNFKSGNSE